MPLLKIQDGVIKCVNSRHGNKCLENHWGEHINYTSILKNREKFNLKKKGRKKITEERMVFSMKDADSAPSLHLIPYSSIPLRWMET